VTSLTRSVVRRTGVHHRTDEIVVELQKGFLVARLKGLPSSRHAIGYADLYEMLAWRDARAAANEKAIEKAKAKRRKS